LTIYFLPVWGFIWLIIAIVFFALGVLVGLAAFKVRTLEEWFFSG